MDCVKWPPSVSKAFKEQFSLLPDEVFERLFENATSQVFVTDKHSMVPLLFDMPFEGVSYAVSLHLHFSCEGDDRVITRFEGHAYPMPLPG